MVRDKCQFFTDRRKIESLDVKEDELDWRECVKL